MAIGDAPAFDMARQGFLRALRDMLNDRGISELDKTGEIAATLMAMGSILAMHNNETADV